MLVLFDQGTPVPIRPFLIEHTVETASERGWQKLKNGDLLKAAQEAGFEVFVTRRVAQRRARGAARSGFKGAGFLTTTMKN